MKDTTSSNCIFCKIIKGELPAVKIYETDNILVIQALFQTTKGHTLIIPKEHKINILENSLDISKELMLTIQTIGNAIITGLNAEGFNVHVNVNEAAGQDIFHTHIHLIPRWKDDNLKMWSQEQVSEEERLILAQSIIKELD